VQMAWMCGYGRPGAEIAALGKMDYGMKVNEML
jgi:hypothetical protein